MTENDKKDVLKDVQMFIHNNVNNGDVDVLMGAMEKAIRDNYILDSDAIEVLDFIDRNVGGLCGDKPYKGNEPKCELETSIWDRGSKCFALVHDAVHKLQKKYANKMQPQQGGSDAASKMQPQQKDKKKRGRKVCPFLDCILIEDKMGLLKKLKERLTGRKGKDVSLVIGVLVMFGVLSKPHYKQVCMEFGDIGSSSGYYKYLPVDRHTIDEVEGVRHFFADYIK